MALRNFWVSCRIDGRETELSGGPRAKDGGLSIDLLQRDGGEKITAVKIRCWEDGGELVTRVEFKGETVAIMRTRR